MNINPTIQTDFYKIQHYIMDPPGTIKKYSNLTPRKSRLPGVNSVVVFGIQYWILEYVIKQWDNEFFGYTRGEYAKKDVIDRYKRMMDYTLGKDSISTKHLEDLWDLGYMPLHIKALPEGTLCPIGVPCLTITNTVDHAYWLVNYLETILSCTTWQAMTSATIAHEYKKLLSKYAEETGDPSFVQWQGHDFSMRGMSSLESACISGAGHLLSFTGTDTIPAISFLEQYYGADVEKELVGASVPATEHSVMCMGSKEDEVGTFKRLLDQFPTGILSVVSDTWDLWKVLTEYLPQLKEQILKREGKLVIRPDSGDPVDILCGRIKPVRRLHDTFMNVYCEGNYYTEIGNKPWEGPEHRKMKSEEIKPEDKGVIELLWDTFGGTINDKGYKQLDSHIGAIYGDSITLERAKAICERLKSKGFASTNVVLGIGSYTYQYNTRDTFGFAVKATYGEVLECEPHKCPAKGIGCGRPECSGISKPVGREIFKDPITDDGTKKSKKGLLKVIRDHNTGNLLVIDQATPEMETTGLLETVFLDGKLVKFQTLNEIRNRLNKEK